MIPAYISKNKIPYAYTLRSTVKANMLLTDWLHTFIEITPDNRRNVAKILYTVTHECNTPLSKPVGTH